MTSRRASIDRLVQRFGGGGTVTMRRRSTLANAATGAPVSALTLGASVSLGASSLSLTASNLVGSVPAGLVLTVAGVSGSYTVQSAAVASGGSVAVTVSPVLASGASAGAAVTITQGYGEQTIRRARGRLTAEATDPSQRVAAARRYHLSAVGVTYAPAVGQVLVDGAEIADVLHVRTRESGAEVTGWIVEVGDAAA